MSVFTDVTRCLQTLLYMEYLKLLPDWEECGRCGWTVWKTNIHFNSNLISFIIEEFMTQPTEINHGVHFLFSLCLIISLKSVGQWITSWASWYLYQLALLASWKFSLKSTPVTINFQHTFKLFSAHACQTFKFFTGQSVTMRTCGKVNRKNLPDWQNFHQTKNSGPKKTDLTAASLGLPAILSTTFYS